MQQVPRLLAVAVAMAVPFGAASAQSVTGIDAVFETVVGGNSPIIDNSNPDNVRVCWPGTGAVDCSALGDPGMSGYSFERRITPFLPGLNTPFALGDFTHFNFTIPSGSGISSVDLAFSFTIGGAVPSTFSDTWTLTHEETPNTAPCPYPGGAACADRVSFSVSGGGGPTPFVYDGNNYVLTLFGFGATAEEAGLNPSFITLESQANTTQLWAQIVAPSETVPEPATMTLLATGLAGMAAARRRRKA